MKVIVAKTAGFCWGVKRAMDAVLEASNRSNNVQTLGPLIHNPQALELIANRGVGVATSPDSVRSGVVVVRAHGIPIQALRKLKERHEKGELEVVNATCPEVAKVHNKIKKWSPQGYFTIILGSKGHPESTAHLSFAESGAMIVSNLEEAKVIPKDHLKRCLIVAQTTFTVKDFHEISAFIEKQAIDCIVENTICEDTWMRQDEAESLSQRVDAVVVIGGRESSNTKHLADLVQRQGKPVQFVETAQEIDVSQYQGTETVGVLAGASTPTWLVDEVEERLCAIGISIVNKYQRYFMKIYLTPLSFALGSAFASWGINIFLRVDHPFAHAALVGLFVLGMYLIAPYLDPLGLNVRGPLLAAMLGQAQVLTTAVAMLLLLGCGFIAYGISERTMFVTFSIMTIGLFYRVPLSIAGKWLSLKLIPGSKDIFVALAISLITFEQYFFSNGFTFIQPFWRFFLFMVVFSVSLFIRIIYNLKEMRNDQTLGNETLAIYLGKEKALLLMHGTCTLMIGTILWGITFSYISSAAGLILILALAYPPFYWWYYYERFTAGQPLISFRPESSLFVLGFLSFF